MSNFSAIISTDLMASANAELEAKGYGPNNFSVPAYAGANPTYALMHSWSDAQFQADVALIAGVTINDTDSDPYASVTAVTTDVGATWANNALPLTGVVTPGLYRYSDNSLWWVIQQYDTATWPDPYAPGLTALVIPARTPGVATEWVQPTNQFTAYYLVNPFTALPDEVYFEGLSYKVTQADGAGLNVWPPAGVGAFGWSLIQ
jgi:hypothetical protein